TADLLRARQALSQLSYSPVSLRFFLPISLLAFASSLGCLELNKNLSQTVLNIDLFTSSTPVKANREEVYWSKRRPV
ncbi:hypothetical protein, partial [Shewanella algae]|uniref:hypothetical protein n=2 Tax=Shewanella algae TaxID=38313 RepID=UPI0031F55C25